MASIEEMPILALIFEAIINLVLICIILFLFVVDAVHLSGGWLKCFWFIITFLTDLKAVAKFLVFGFIAWYLFDHIRKTVIIPQEEQQQAEEISALQQHNEQPQNEDDKTLDARIDHDAEKHNDETAIIQEQQQSQQTEEISTPQRHPAEVSDLETVLDTNNESIIFPDNNIFNNNHSNFTELPQDEMCMMRNETTTSDLPTSNFVVFFVVAAICFLIAAAVSYFRRRSELEAKERRRRERRERREAEEEEEAEAEAKARRRRERRERKEAEEAAEATERRRREKKERKEEEESLEQTAPTEVSERQKRATQPQEGKEEMNEDILMNYGAPNESNDDSSNTVDESSPPSSRPVELQLQAPTTPAEFDRHILLSKKLIDLYSAPWRDDDDVKGEGTNESAMDGIRSAQEEFDLSRLHVVIQEALEKRSSHEKCQDVLEELFVWDYKAFKAQRGFITRRSASSDRESATQSIDGHEEYYRPVMLEIVDACDNDRAARLLLDHLTAHVELKLDPMTNTWTAFDVGLGYPKPGRFKECDSCRSKSRALLHHTLPMSWAWEPTLSESSSTTSSASAIEETENDIWCPIHQSLLIIQVSEKTAEQRKQQVQNRKEIFEEDFISIIESDDDLQDLRSTLDIVRFRLMGLAASCPIYDERRQFRRMIDFSKDFDNSPIGRLFDDFARYCFAFHIDESRGDEDYECSECRVEDEDEDEWEDYEEEEEEEHEKKVSQNLNIPSTPFGLPVLPPSYTDSDIDKVANTIIDRLSTYVQFRQVRSFTSTAALGYPHPPNFYTCSSCRGQAFPPGTYPTDCSLWNPKPSSDPCDPARWLRAWKSIISSQSKSKDLAGAIQRLQPIRRKIFRIMQRGREFDIYVETKQEGMPVQWVVSHKDVMQWPFEGSQFECAFRGFEMTGCIELLDTDDPDIVAQLPRCSACEFPHLLSRWNKIQEEKFASEDPTRSDPAGVITEMTCILESARHVGPFMAQHGTGSEISLCLGACFTQLKLVPCVDFIQQNDKACEKFALLLEKLFMMVGEEEFVRMIKEHDKACGFDAADYIKQKILVPSLKQCKRKDKRDVFVTVIDALPKSETTEAAAAASSNQKNNKNPVEVKTKEMSSPATKKNAAAKIPPLQPQKKKQDAPKQPAKILSNKDHHKKKNNQKEAIPTKHEEQVVSRNGNDDDDDEQQLLQTAVANADYDATRDDDSDEVAIESLMTLFMVSREQAIGALKRSNGDLQQAGALLSDEE